MFNLPLHSELYTVHYYIGDAGLFKTITTLFRATAAEAEEALFDANAVRLLEQRLREANTAFDVAKRDLAMVLAEEAGEARAASTFAERIGKLESEAATALAEGKDATAEEIAIRIAGMEDERIGHRDARARCAETAKRIRTQLEDHARLLAELKRGLATARAAAALERSRDRTARHRLMGGDAFREARVTLDRVRARQSRRADFDEALTSVERDLADRTYPDTSMHDRPRTDPKAILERLKKRVGEHTAN